MLQYFEDEEYEQLVQDAQTFGFTEKNELWNGRYAIRVLEAVTEA